MQRKVHRACGGFVVGCRCVQAAQNVVKVVVPIAQMRHAQLRHLDGDGINHRGQAKNRLRFSVHIDLGDLELGGTAVQRCNGQISDSELQRPRLEVNRTDGQLAPQGFAAFGLDLRLEQRRHRHPGQHPQSQQARHGPCNTTFPGQKSSDKCVHKTSMYQRQPACGGITPDDPDSSPLGAKAEVPSLQSPGCVPRLRARPLRCGRLQCPGSPRHGQYAKSSSHVPMNVRG